jgi:SulP family sulfate permease
MMTAVRRLPVLISLRGYRRAWVSADLVAGVTLLVIAVPEQLATSRLAGMPPITGFYAFVAGTVAFALFGASPVVSVGADSTIAPLFAVGVTSLAATGSGAYVHLVALLAVMVGALVLLVSLLRLGWVAEFLSTPIVTGFLSGVAVIIVIHQLPDFLGLAPPGGSNAHRIGYVVSHLNAVNGWTVAVGLGVLAVVGVCARSDRRIPGALVGMVGAMVVVIWGNLESRGVAVLGPVHTGAPRLGLSGVSWSSVRSLAPLAAVVALVVVTQTAATTRGFAAQRREDADAGRDFLGVGAGNLAAGLVGAFPVDASPPRTGAVASAGGRSQAGALVAAGAVLVLVPFADVLRNVPLTALAAVLIAVAFRIFDLHGMVAIARFSVLEFGLAAVTLVTVVLIGVEQGIAVAVLLAILDRIRLSARPQLHVLGRVPGTTSWAPTTSVPQVPVERGVLVTMFATPVWYANAVHFREEVAKAIAEASGPVRVLVLDTIGMSDIDFTGTRALSEIVRRCAEDHIVLGIARAGEHLRASLRRAGLASRIGEDRFYETVDQAVRALAPGPPLS